MQVKKTVRSNGQCTNHSPTVWFYSYPKSRAYSENNSFTV